jgi:hypothetical protein
LTRPAVALEERLHRRILVVARDEERGEPSGHLDIHLGARLEEELRGFDIPGPHRVEKRRPRLQVPGLHVGARGKQGFDDTRATAARSVVQRRQALRGGDVHPGPALDQVLHHLRRLRRGRVERRALLHRESVHVGALAVEVVDLLEGIAAVRIEPRHGDVEWRHARAVRKVGRGAGFDEETLHVEVLP